MEADLQRHYGVELGDHWRGDPATGRRRLTYRRLHVLLSNLPPGQSAVQQALFPDLVHLSTTDVLVAGVYAALAGKQHPLAEKAGEAARALPDPERDRRLAEGRRRLAKRRRDIAEGRIP